MLLNAKSFPLLVIKFKLFIIMKLTIPNELNRVSKRFEYLIGI